jgi:hypothetical protein
MSEKIDAVRLTFYMAPLTASMLLPLMAVVELPQVVAFVTHQGYHTVGREPPSRPSPPQQPACVTVGQNTPRNAHRAKHAHWVD